MRQQTQRQLAAWGYPIMQSSQWDSQCSRGSSAPSSAITGQERVDGQWDTQCAGRLANLLAGRYKQPGQIARRSPLLVRAGEESPGLHGKRWRVTPAGGDPRESATENETAGLS